MKNITAAQIEQIHMVDRGFDMSSIKEILFIDTIRKGGDIEFLMVFMDSNNALSIGRFESTSGGAISDHKIVVANVSKSMAEIEMEIFNNHKKKLQPLFTFSPISV